MSATRILCFHGYHGSAAILRRQIAPVAASVPAEVELVFVDAPSLSRGGFGWWHEGFRGWEDTRDWAMELVGRQQFDGLFGFSQGAALVGLLGAIADGESAPISFDMAVMVSGFRAACRNTSTSSRASCVFRRCASSAALTALCRCMILCSWPSASLIRRSSSTTEDMSSPTTRRSPRESLISYDLEPRSRARSKAIDARRGRRGGLGVSAARSGQPD